jgi:hypothetical protein
MEIYTMQVYNTCSNMHMTPFSSLAYQIEEMKGLEKKLKALLC